MRISADPKNPSFFDWHMFAQVYLDGELLKMCITADDEVGTAECLRTDSNGSIVVLAGEAQTHTLYGRVEIIIPSMSRLSS